MENEHGPCALADDEVALPMTSLGSGVDIFGPFMDGDAILYGISRRPRSTRAAAFVTSREITPQLLGLLGGAVDEGVARTWAGATITLAGDEPGFVVVPGELDERGSQLFDRIEGPRPPSPAVRISVSILAWAGHHGEARILCFVL